MQIIYRKCLDKSIILLCKTLDILQQNSQHIKYNLIKQSDLYTSFSIIDQNFEH